MRIRPLDAGDDARQRDGFVAVVLGAERMMRKERSRSQQERCKWNRIHVAPSGKSIDKIPQTGEAGLVELKVGRDVKHVLWREETVRLDRGSIPFMNELSCHHEHRGSTAVLHDDHTFRNRAPHVRDEAEHPPEARWFFQMPRLGGGRAKT
jgi:hypothetical protein